MFFSNFYATGTRTVKGMEVLSMAIPPLPGQSIVRRPDNDGLFTLGSVLRSKGYITQFLYGGYSSFDNMGSYFRQNGYDVIDRSALKKEEIHYANIWGVADEDMFSYSLKKFDENYRQQKPFFSQIMTVSNHRPYTYPENRIDISPKKQIRDGAVKYTDYAIGRFLKEASAKPWFANTIFVIVADHCAYAAGKSTLPVSGYHIPLWIYCPSMIRPQVITKLTSQIDLAPTILGFLNMSYRSKFFGQDIFRMPEGTERIFLSTYQGLGYLRNDRLIVQLPPKHTEELVPDFKTGASAKTEINDSLYRQAVSYYQIAERIYKSGGYKMNPPEK
jgi:phosphoglycerol transferase MdoB-like AlkP superfamily enzyme